MREDRWNESGVAERNPHFTFPQARACQDFELEEFAWGVYVLLSKVDGPCGRCMVEAMVFTEVVDRNQSVVCDALVGGSDGLRQRLQRGLCQLSRSG